MSTNSITISQLSTKDLGLILLGLSGLGEPIIPAAFKELSPKERQRVKELYLAIKVYALDKVGKYYDKELIQPDKDTTDYSTYPSYPVP